MALNNIPVSAPGLPVDLQTEMLQLARRRKIAEAMQANALSKNSPVTMVGRVAVPNWGDAIGSIADAIASKRATEGLDQQEQAVAQQYNDRLQKGVTDFANQVQGGPQSVGQDTRALDESGAQGAPPDAMMNL
ncbi:MAG TPA: hypothetical protein VIY48_08350, partial [Candidatus Paceibacterota bacterium]